MSTFDVPGYRAENQDALASGCWAEHADGSLMVVGSVDADWVRYLIFDPSVSPVGVMADIMHEAEFKETYSRGAPKFQGIDWLWHDKTPFPWGALMSAKPQASAATHAGRHRSLNAKQMRPEHVRKLIASHGVENNRPFVEAFDVLATK